ncbi:hypothetical protein UY3_13867 [Chelonia mydas]|uniref:Uncharacterized protein n=1 Tax=Chelonia mydas TaxID=8469 RepID=M7BLG3_CHEMY|nr:hypothetical protein UY3_13867 [Chelonia mydas]
MAKEQADWSAPQTLRQAPDLAETPTLTGGVDLDCEFRKTAKLRAAVKLQGIKSTNKRKTHQDFPLTYYA